jgi:hypothetical protein
MKIPEAIQLDGRDGTEFAEELLRRLPGFVPEWRKTEHGIDHALLRIAAQYLSATTQRLNQAAFKNKLAFLNYLGIDLIPPVPARVPIVFRMADRVSNGRLPAGTRVAAPPPPERNEQIIFETERGAGLASAKLKAIVSLWPGRDQYIDHTSTYLQQAPFYPYRKRDLTNTPHCLDIAHSTLLALAGKSHVEVVVDLTTGSSEHLEVDWEYWDGKVWREFARTHRQCSNEVADRQDSTNGFQKSGRFQLETDCAESSETTIDGINAFWIRAKLNEPLPPLPAQVLPEIDQIRLATVIERSLMVRIKPPQEPQNLGSGDERHLVRFRDETGAPIKGIRIVEASTNNKLGYSDGDGQVDLKVSTQSVVSVGDKHVFIEPLQLGKVVSVSLEVAGLSPDKAFADTVAIDVSKPFTPFGAQPTPGATFYFTNKEVFSKPGAKLQIYVQTAKSPQDELTLKELRPVAPAAKAAAVQPQSREAALPHTVIWEYWNGTEWTSAALSRNAPAVPLPSKNGDLYAPEDFSGSGVIEELVVPRDLSETEINGAKALWMRVRLVNGSYGVRREMIVGRETFPIVIIQPPTIAKFLLGYTWQDGPHLPEHVLTYNDFQYVDRTEEATIPGKIFQPFTPVSDQTPALYLGFDQALPVDRVGLLFHILEQPDDSDGPPLTWEFWNGVTWKKLEEDDETRFLRVPGIVNVIGSPTSQPYARFGEPLHWLRARLKEDGPPGEPTIRNVYLNGVWAVQHQTVVNEPLGASTGEPNQAFFVRQLPLLGGEAIEVRELAGLRANVEWRTVAMEVFNDDARAVAELERDLPRQSLTDEIVRGDLRLVRDRMRRVTEVWVRWYRQPHFYASTAKSRHYVPDRVRGAVFFGDHVRGKVPPIGALIQARRYQAGGGIIGNVPEMTVKQLVGPIGGVEEVFNPLPGAGGGDRESFETYASRAPLTLKRRGRALTLRDYEVLAREANANVAVAKAVSCRDASGHGCPGWVTVFIIPRTIDPQIWPLGALPDEVLRPWPMFGLREEVRKVIQQAMPAGPDESQQLVVTGPAYKRLDVKATIAPMDPAEAGAVEQRTRRQLERFLHPLFGGPDQEGWEPGRAVYLSDVASVIERVEGVDYVQQLQLFFDNQLQGNQAPMREGQVVVTGQIEITMIVGD